MVKQISNKMKKEEFMVEILGKLGKGVKNDKQAVLGLCKEKQGLLWYNDWI